jgi:rfaE bifunctional protein nucleotidyltransferase chain/domain/rfaE bifunctional protein kinase chain/domain
VATSPQAAGPLAPPVTARAAAPSRRRAGRRRLVVVGDVVLDRDLLGRSERVAPDAPVPVVDLEEVQESPGGAGLTALLAATGDVEVTLVTPLADDDAAARLGEALRTAPNPVTLVALGHSGATRTKTRVRVGGQSLVRLDEGGPGTPRDVDAGQLAAALAGADVVLVSDYGAGTTTDPVVREALVAAARRVPLVWDPHPRGGEPVPGAALVTPNLAEAQAVGVLGGGGAANGAQAAPDALAAALAARWRARSVVVTAGAQGAWLASAGSDALFVPAAVVTGGDPCGAGDRFAASAALALAAGKLPSEAVVTAVRDASAWVASGGASGWREADRAAAVQEAGTAAPGGAEEVLARVRARGGTVVATGGCFDVLHAGHVACLDAARRLGDVLVVLLNSDDSVRRLKGPSRPVSGQEDRARVLAALDSVDAVVVFDEDDPRAALDRLRPDVWAKGGDYGAAELPEAPLVRSWGGRVVLLPYLDGRSTTSILARGAAGATAGAHP